MKPIASTDETIDGLNTQIFVQNYADRVLVLVTQLGKVGCLIQASLPQTVQLSTTTNPSSSSIQGGGGEEEPRPSNLPPSSPATELTPIFGHPPTNELHPFYNLLVAQLATIIWISEESPSSFAGGDGAGAAGGGSTSYGGTRRPVIVGLALKYRHLSDETKMGATFHGIAEAVVRLLNAP